MLSWSSQQDGYEADPEALTTGTRSVGVPLGDELIAFASAFAGRDHEHVAVTRQRLVDQAGEAFMVDAAAVAANFEMMTRVADGSGARFADDIDAVGASATWVSARRG
jgi:hypothetical protein